MAIDKIFYNEASSSKLGWKPDWFGVEDFDEELVDEIRKWQRRHGLKSDGLCGPSTFRRVFTDREQNVSEYKPGDFSQNANETNHIVHNGNFIPIEWDKVVLWDDDGGLGCADGTYSSYAGKPDRKPHFFVNHWDVCLSAASCAKVIKKRGISIHFCIDNDGTIYQLLDTQHAAWQAGGRKWNHDSIGVEISNAYYTKYQDWYVRNGFGKRPVVKKGEAKVHGRDLGEHLGFYPVQLEALKALWAAIHKGVGIPLECPEDRHGNLVEAVDKRCEASEFEGFINHYNLTRRKIDCGGLELKSMLAQTKKLL
mgnify:CR=1 FL=1|tara:strand:+ start:694 stop:1623 length:930 start_codon:yes stop_codon:yes gene_type:complete